jgi:hypothetical protein
MPNPNLDTVAGRDDSVIICPHCGAENADKSAYCSLCLARFGSSEGVSDAIPRQDYPPPQQAAQQPQPYVSPGDYRALAQETAEQNTPGGYGDTSPQQQYPDPQQAAQQPQPYVSPGDYRALAQEMAQQPQAGYRDTAYYQAAMQHPDAISRVKAPLYMRQRSMLDIAIMVLVYSLATFSIIFVLGIVISMWQFGAAFGGSEDGFSFGIMLMYILEALVIALGGYAISAKAMHAGKGWLYGAGCAACTLFVWQPAVFMVIIFLMTGEVYVPLFSLIGILFAVFLFLPMGALGGWFAEKRYVG